MKHLRYLNIYLWKYKNILFLGLVFIFITNIFAIYPAEFVRNALNELIDKLNSESNDTSSLILLKYGYTEKRSEEIYHNHIIKDFVGIEKIVSQYL